MKCQRCGQDMEPGNLLAPIGRTVAGMTFRWAPPEATTDYLAIKSVSVGPPKIAFNISLPGFRCQNCSLLLVDYGSANDKKP